MMVLGSSRLIPSIFPDKLATDPRRIRLTLTCPSGERGSIVRISRCSSSKTLSADCFLLGRRGSRVRGRGMEGEWAGEGGPDELLGDMGRSLGVEDGGSADWPLTCLRKGSSSRLLDISSSRSFSLSACFSSWYVSHSANLSSRSLLRSSSISALN